MIFVAWVTIWVLTADRPQMFLVPLLATVARARLLGRPLAPPDLRIALLSLVIGPSLVFVASVGGGATVVSGMVGAIRIPVSAMCLNQALSAVGSIDLQGAKRLADGALRIVLLGRFAGLRARLDGWLTSAAFASLLFDRCVDVHTRRLRGVMASTRARLRVAPSTRERARIVRAAVVQLGEGLIRMVGEYFGLATSRGRLPSLTKWAVAGKAAALRPVPDLLLLVLGLLPLFWSGADLVPAAVARLVTSIGSPR